MDEIAIGFASAFDLEFLAARDTHISPEMLVKKIHDNEILLMKRNDRPVGWLRFGYFWDEIPFMNLLYLEEGFRRRGLGSRLVSHWENLMRGKGYGRVLTSTLSNEEARHFYVKIGYAECGSILLEGEPALEILLFKDLK